MTVLPADLHRLRIVGSPAVAPDGSVVVSVQRSASDAAYAHRLWRLGEGAEPSPVVDEDGAWAELAARFSPDGTHLAFVSDRSGDRKVWLHEVDRRLTMPAAALPGSVRQVLWIDQRQLLALVDTPAPVYEPGIPASVSWLRYKSDGRATFFERPSELWRASIGEPWQRLATPFGRITALDVSSRLVAYALAPLCSDTIDDTVQVRQLRLDTEQDSLLWSCPAPIDALALSDTQASVVAVTAGRPGPQPHQRGLWRVRPDSPPEELFAAADLSFEYAVQGDAHRAEPPARMAVPLPGGAILAAATAGEDVALFSGDPGTGTLRRLTAPGSSVTDFAVSRAGRLAVCLESPGRPAELFVGDLPAPALGGTPPRAATNTTTIAGADTGLADVRIWTHANDPWASDAGMALPTRMTATAADGTVLSGLLYLAAGPGPHPLLVRVHGGPHLTSGTSFNFEVQTQVSAGYAVLLPNIRGSAGWGQAFRSAIMDQWGRLDYSDLMTLVDAAVERPEIDAERLYLAGGSYGGFLTNWTVTQTNRFRAAVSERSISNFTSKYGTSDNGFLFNRNELGGADLFDESVAELVDRSPLRHAASIRTPLLLLHGEDDQRCPIEQSEQLFVALRRLGREATMVRFAGESHEFGTRGRPDHRIARLRLILSWLDGHT